MMGTDLPGAYGNSCANPGAGTGSAPAPADGGGNYSAIGCGVRRLSQSHLLHKNFNAATSVEHQHPPVQFCSCFSQAASACWMIIELRSSTTRRTC